MRKVKTKGKASKFGSSRIHKISSVKVVVKAWFIQKITHFYRQNLAKNTAFSWTGA